MIHMKAVIFDLDGTLTDSLESIAYCTNRSIGKFGFPPFEKERYKYFVGDGAAELVKRVLIADGDTDLAYYDKAKAEYDKNFEEDCMRGVVPYKGIPETIQALKERGVKIAVCSNKPHERTLDVIYQVFGKETFDMVQGQTPSIERKPSPESVFHIARTLGINMQDIVYVGDTSTDMKTGKSAGAFTVGVLWGFRDREELEEHHADMIIEKPCELLNL